MGNLYTRNARARGQCRLLSPVCCMKRMVGSEEETDEYKHKQPQRSGVIESNAKEFEMPLDTFVLFRVGGQKSKDKSHVIHIDDDWIVTGD